VRPCRKKQKKTKKTKKTKTMKRHLFECGLKVPFRFCIPLRARKAASAF
jgi:hypothetical protein